MKNKISKITCLIVTLILCVSAIGCSLFNFDTGSKEDLPNSNQGGSNVSFEQQTSERTLYTDYMEVANIVKRSVVSIKMDYNVEGTEGTSYGSGVIIKLDSQYYIVTCHHVISSMGDITVYIPDANGRNVTDSDYNEDYVFKGVIAPSRVINENNGIALIGGDKDSDIALLKLNTGSRAVDIVSAPVPAQGYSVQYAEKIFTIGNPSGELPMTFMSGNISYIDREVNIDSVGEMTLLQHNASITHGSSGGALFNMYGELIGITNAGSDEYYNLNYAIPFSGTNGYVNIVSQLLSSYNNLQNNFGYVTGRWILGVTVTAATLPVQNSIVNVMSVTEGSNCYGKILTNDRIIGVKFTAEGKQHSLDVQTVADFSYAVSQLKKYFVSSPSNPPTITIVVYRSSEGAKKDVEIQLKEQFIFCDTGMYN